MMLMWKSDDNLQEFSYFLLLGGFKAFNSGCQTLVSGSYTNYIISKPNYKTFLGKINNMNQ